MVSLIHNNNNTTSVYHVNKLVVPVVTYMALKDIALSAKPGEKSERGKCLGDKNMLR